MSLGSVRIRDLIRAARARDASDLHFGGTDLPVFRLHGRIVASGTAAVAEPDVRLFLDATLGRDQLQRLDSRGAADGVARGDDDSAPYRIHAYRNREGVRVAIRLLAQRLPSLDALALPASVATFAGRRSGLVLFTGPTGCGKTTALAALLDRINRSSDRVIVTIEDPVEYVHRSQRSLVTQCEIGRDVADYAEALRGALRADPDVILIGEMRDPVTMEAALTAAETGHLVFATLHTNDVAQTVDRIVDAFPSTAHAQIRAQLAATLAGIVGLRLVARRDGSGRRAAAEVLVENDAVRALIRDGKNHQLRNVLVTGRNAGMQTLEMHLAELVMRGEITPEAARAATARSSELQTFSEAAAAR